MTAWIVFAPETPAADWHWRSAAADPVAGSGDAAQLSAALGSLPPMPVTVLLPSAQVLTVPVNAPQRQERQLLQALPFLLEENLAGDIDSCHVVAGRRLDAQRLQLAAVDRARLWELLEQLRGMAVDPAVVSSEALALPLPEAGATVLLDGTRSLLATVDGHTLDFDQADVTTVLAAIPFAAGQTVRILCTGRGDPLLARALESELLTLPSPPQVQVEESPVERQALLAATLATMRPVNLRQGVFAHTDESAFALGFDWRPLAWLLASWLVLALGYQIAVGISHARAAAAVHETQVALYRQIFPGAKNVPHPRAQMEGQLKGAAGGGAAFTELVAGLSEAIAAAGPGRYTPRSLAWDADQGQLRIDIVAHNLEDLEKLRHDLEQRGFGVDIGSGVSQDGGYKARMNVGKGGHGGGR